MGGAIGQILPLAIGVAISPLPIVAVILMLVTPRAKANGPAFVIGWIVGLAVVGTIVLALIGPSSSGTEAEPATWVSLLLLVLGLLLFVVAARQWRSRPKEGVDPPTPKWMGAIDGFNAVKAAGAGAVLSGANPKNLLIAVGAATAIAQTGISGAEQAGAYAVFTLLATVGVAAPVVVFFALGARARDVLDRLKVWMIHNNATIMAVLLLVIGAKLVGDAITGLSS